MDLRSAEELAAVENPAWPSIEALIARPGSVARALPIARADGEASLHALQVTAASALGALALNCGGLLVDAGWLRILGGGAEGLPSIAVANGLQDPSTIQAPPGHLIVAFDVLGGRFAVDGGGLGVNSGNVCYWAPDSLAWEDTGLGHGDFVHAFINGAATGFYADLRWSGWTEDVAALALDQGLSLWPPPFTVEGKDLASVSRRPVPFVELLGFYDDAARQF
jgi:hypothetical protein